MQEHDQNEQSGINLLKNKSVVNDTPNPSTAVAYTYELKKSLITETERKYLSAIKQLLPQDYYIQPQVNLASIITKNDNSKFYNELYRNIDACIFDKAYKPIVLIEINDQTHNTSKRKERDKKVQFICEEAGIPIVAFWTSYGVNTEYISQRILKAIEQAKNPVRVAHIKENKDDENIPSTEGNNTQEKSSGCYIATSVYGSYNCPEVWTLRRFRDYSLASTWYGRAFIHAYYFISPKLVKWFGNKKWFKKLWRHKLDNMIINLKIKGYESSAYKDLNW